MIDDVCPVSKQQMIVEKMAAGDGPGAQRLYQDCQREIRHQNADLNRWEALNLKAWTNGLSDAEKNELDEKRVSGLKQVKDERVELLNAIKSKEKPDGLCKIDYDPKGNPYLPAVAITCDK